MMQLYVDMDGVLADFDKQYESRFGVKSDKALDNVDWKKVRESPGFYADMPPMFDMWVLWEYIRKYNPIVLTGIPTGSNFVPEAEANKQAWVRKTIGSYVRVFCCASKDKSNFCKPRDVLIDDWDKYKSKWEDRGGVWVTHTNAIATISKLKDLGM